MNKMKTFLTYLGVDYAETVRTSNAIYLKGYSFGNDWQYIDKK